MDSKFQTLQNQRRDCLFRASVPNMDPERAAFWTPQKIKIPSEGGGMKQIGHLKGEVLPSVRALVFWVLVNTDFSKASLALRVGQSSEKYFTATRFPSPSKSKMFLINGVDTWSNQDEWKVFDQIRRNLNTHTDNETQSARAHSRSKKPFISDNIPPCFTKKLKNKIKSSTNICVSKFWIRDLGVLLLLLLLVKMTLLLGGARKFRCQMRLLQSRLPLLPS